MSAKILIVDDEPPIIDVLSYNLSQANYEVVVARDGEEALAVARQEEPDLITQAMHLDAQRQMVEGMQAGRRSPA